MALIRTIPRVERTARAVHEAVDCQGSIFRGSDGERYVQIDTFGTRGRKEVGKVSQSLQIGRSAAADLLKMLRDAFPDLAG